MSSFLYYTIQTTLSLTLPLALPLSKLADVLASVFLHKQHEHGQVKVAR